MANQLQTARKNLQKQVAAGLPQASADAEYARLQTLPTAQVRAGNVAAKLPTSSPVPMPTSQPMPDYRPPSLPASSPSMAPPAAMSSAPMDAPNAIGGSQQPNQATDIHVQGQSQLDPSTLAQLSQAFMNNPNTMQYRNTGIAPTGPMSQTPMSAPGGAQQMSNMGFGGNSMPNMSSMNAPGGAQQVSNTGFGGNSMGWPSGGNQQASNTGFGGFGFGGQSAMSHWNRNRQYSGF